MRLVPAAFGLLLMLALASAAAAQPVSPETRHASGIALLAPLDHAALRAAGPMYEPLAIAVSDAWDLAQQNPTNFGYPWADRSTNELVISVVNARGEKLAREWIETGALHYTKISPWHPRKPEVPVRFRSVERSFAELEQIKHDLTFPGVAGYTGETRIWMTGPDPEKNRVLAETDRVNDEFLVALAAKYGTDVIAIRIDPRSRQFGSIGAETTSWTAESPNTIAIAGGIAVGATAVALVVLRRRRRP